MTVYVIISGDLYDADFDGVFSTLEKAEAYKRGYLRAHPKHYCEIHQTEMDAGGYDLAPAPIDSKLIPQGKAGHE